MALDCRGHIPEINICEIFMVGLRSPDRVRSGLASEVDILRASLQEKTLQVNALNGLEVEYHLRVEQALEEKDFRISQLEATVNELMHASGFNSSSVDQGQSLIDLLKEREDEVGVLEIKVAKIMAERGQDEALRCSLTDSLADYEMRVELLRREVCQKDGEIGKLRDMIANLPLSDSCADVPPAGNSPFIEAIAARLDAEIQTRRCVEDENDLLRNRVKELRDQQEAELTRMVSEVGTQTTACVTLDLEEDLSQAVERLKLAEQRVRQFEREAVASANRLQDQELIAAKQEEEIARLKKRVRVVEKKRLTQNSIACQTCGESATQLQLRLYQVEDALAGARRDLLEMNELKLRCLQAEGGSDEKFSDKNSPQNMQLSLVRAQSRALALEFDNALLVAKLERMEQPAVPPTRKKNRSCTNFLNWTRSRNGRSDLFAQI